jgi:hypothetical protein
MTLLRRNALLLSSSASLLLGLGGTAMSQTAAPAGSDTTKLPGITVVAPHRVQPPRRPKVRVVTGQRRETPAAPPPPTEAQVVAGQNTKFDEALHMIDAPIGATSTQINHQAIEALPQGTNASLDKVLLQFPGVTQDSAASGERMRATSTPTFNIASTASCCPTASALSGKSSIPASSAVLRF